MVLVSKVYDPPVFASAAFRGVSLVQPPKNLFQKRVGGVVLLAQGTDVQPECSP